MRPAARPSRALVLALARPLLSRQAHPFVDEGIYGYMAAGPQATGEPLYVASFDNKPVGLLWLLQAVHAFSPDRLWQARVAEGLLSLGGSLLLLLWLGAEVSPAAGWVAAFAYLLLLNLTPGPVALTEPPMACFSLAGMAAAYYAFRWGRPAGWLLAGVCMALATNFKQVAVLDLLALLVTATWWLRGSARRWGALGLTLAGFGLVWGLVWLWLAHGGQAPQAWEDTVVSLLRGDQSASARQHLLLLRALGLVVWLLPFTVGLLVLAVRGALAPGEGAAPLAPRALRVQLCLWLLAPALGVAAEGYFFHHQMVPFFVPFAALAGLGFATLAGTGPGRRGARVAWVLLLLSVVPLALRYGWETNRALTAHRDPQDLVEEGIARDVAHLLSPSETMYVVGSTADVYLLCQRRAPTPYFESCCASPELRNDVVGELQHKLPGAVLLAPWVFPFQEDFQRLVETQLLPGRYVLVKTWLLPGQYFEPGGWTGLGRHVTQRTWVQDGYQLYLRTDLAQRAFPRGVPLVVATGAQAPSHLPEPSGLAHFWRRLIGSGGR